MHPLNNNLNIQTSPYVCGFSVCLPVFTGSPPCPPVSPSGCQGRVVRQAEAVQDRWEENVERFWNFVAELNTKTDGVVDSMKKSQISRELEYVSSSDFFPSAPQD